jgi:hypothetical protein
MFAASPGLHGVEHAIYDVWLTNCKGGATTVAGPVPPVVPQPAPPARTSPASAGPGSAPRPPRPTPGLQPLPPPPAAPRRGAVPRRDF